ncbi:MAG TPA: ElyC/SanA/YdcF family protein, partial [Blastocatellia bacterium]|nr:ElyC/SanA/YdcF family protein [Blastocatellia bacterium]
MRIRRRWKYILAALIAAPVLGVALCNLLVVGSTGDRVFLTAAKLPPNDVGLVLGSSPFVVGGVSPHFKGRTEAAAYLYRLGKVKHLLLSGDNHIAGYDEPGDMRAALLSMGVPDSAMTLDYAGFRTLDSVVRAKQVFGLDKLTIVTDDFHAPRAVFLARCYGMDAVAFCSARVPFRYSVETRFREVGARVKAVLDVFVLNKQP